MCRRISQVKDLLARTFSRAASILSSSETTLFNCRVWRSGEEGGVESDKEGDGVVDCSLIFIADLEMLTSFFESESQSKYSEYW